MRTTISIDDRLLEAARARARQQGMTLGKYLEDALRRQLSRRDDEDASPMSIPLFTGGNGLRPGVDASSTRGLLEAMDEGVPLESRR